MIHWRKRRGTQWYLYMMWQATPRQNRESSQTITSRKPPRPPYGRPYLCGVGTESRRPTRILAISDEAYSLGHHAIQKSRLVSEVTVAEVAGRLLGSPD
jgi:hypothetical protein